MKRIEDYIKTHDFKASKPCLSCNQGVSGIWDDIKNWLFGKEEEEKTNVFTWIAAGIMGVVLLYLIIPRKK